MWLASPMSTCDIKMKKIPFFHGFLGICPNMFFSLFFPYSSTNKKTPQKAEFFRGLFKGLWLLFVVVACSFIYLTTRFESKPTGALFAGEKNHLHT